MYNPLRLYMKSSDVGLNVKIKIDSLSGVLDDLLVSPQTKHELITFYTTASLVTGDRSDRVSGIPVSTPDCSVNIPRNLEENTTPCRLVKWDCWLTFGIAYRDLTPSSRILLNIYAKVPSQPERILIGGTTWPLFAESGLLQSGIQKCLVWPNTRADANVKYTKTPCEITSRSGLDDTLLKAEREILINRVFERSTNKRIQPYWLDRLSAQRSVQLLQCFNMKEEAIWTGDDLKTLHKEHKVRLDALTEQKSINHLPDIGLFPSAASGGSPDDDDDNGETTMITSPFKRLNKANTQQPCVYELQVESPPFAHPIVFHQRSVSAPIPEIFPFYADNRIFVLHDLNVRNESPIDAKYAKLARGNLQSSHTLKPSVHERKVIEGIITSPDKNLAVDEKTLLWRFRYVISSNKYALTKFLRCIDWHDEQQVQQGLEMLPDWATIDIADALELLSNYFKHETVRQYAVEQLQTRADHEELESYLLQLVQALRYEESYPSALSTFLINRCCSTLRLSNFFHWYVFVECNDPKMGDSFTTTLKDFNIYLRKVQPSWAAEIEKQMTLRTKLIALATDANKGGGKVHIKQARMKSLMSSDPFHKPIAEFESTCLPHNPSIRVNGMKGEKSIMFKSAMAPILCYFTCPEDDTKEDETEVTKTVTLANGKTVSVKKPPLTSYRIIWKTGDDLRQDQLMMQMINLMDNILKKVNMDCRLTPYVVLATSENDGFVEFVKNSSSFSAVLAENSGDVGKYLHTNNPKPQNLKRAVETFIYSCAGYCVITYLLGIGDRHLDNLMMQPDGHLFHIDFGFIFGKDPKPFPPPMKLVKEMIDAMGGPQSQGYTQFRKLCCAAFNILRKHATLILNLLSLMKDANIEGYGLPGQHEAILRKVEDKFRLDLTDEEAEVYMIQLLTDSVTALFPQFVEQIHKIAMVFK